MERNGKVGVELARARLDQHRLAGVGRVDGVAGLLGPLSIASRGAEPPAHAHRVAGAGRLDKASYSTALVNAFDSSVEYLLWDPDGEVYHLKFHDEPERSLSRNAAELQLSYGTPRWLRDGAEGGWDTARGGPGDSGRN